MNEENKINYYAIIPATVRYDKELKPSEKLIYGEITSLTNRMGYCFANNKYFANLYNVTNHTVSQWISHLDKKGYIQIELIRDKSNAIIERRIYINDIPYVQKNTYPYVQKRTYPMYKNIQYNNKDKIDDLFYLIINKDKQIPSEFYDILQELDFIYSEEILDYMQKEKIKMISDIIFVLYDLYNSKFSTIIKLFTRESLIKLYLLSQKQEPTDLINYYKKAIINEYDTS